MSCPKHEDGRHRRTPYKTHCECGFEISENVVSGLPVDDSAKTLAIPMILWCPQCHARHIDEGAFATRPHATHACQHCGMVWRPAIECTVGVQFLPGFKNE